MDLFKKLLYTSIGLVSVTSEKFQESIDDLVKQRKITQAEGERLLDDFMNNTEAKKEEFESKLRKVTEDVVDNFDFPRRKDINELQNRIAVLEAKLGEYENKPAAKKPATKKTVAKKPAAKKATAKKASTTKATSTKENTADTTK